MQANTKEDNYDPQPWRKHRDCGLQIKHQNKRNIMTSKITNYIRAGYPGIYLLSSEEARVEAELKAIAQSLEYRLYAWSVTEGLIDTSDGTAREAQGPMEVLSLLDETPENSLCVLRDFHPFLEDANPVLTRALKDRLRMGKTKGKVVIIVGCRLMLPPELEREVVVVSFSLPGKEELETVLDQIAVSANQSPPGTELRETLLDAASGLTTVEAENAFALSIVECGQLSATIVGREKANEVKKSGLLELIPATESLGDIGGLELLKYWLVQRKYAFGSEARQYGLPNPKGLLIVGIPGTGKSLTAKATASVFNHPLLKLDTGRLFGGLVGQSENNLRSMIATIEAIAPCVLWVDEIEKGFSGSKSSGFSDGGTSSRVFGTFLSWMQDRTAPVFVVATANDVSQLPPELLRKGRFDELFFIDLPSHEERETIWRIHIAKHRRQPGEFDTQQLAEATEGWTGSEIEQAFVDALYDGFSRNEEPTDLNTMMQVNQVVPLSKLMNEQISGLRSWAKGRARLATKLKTESRGRKILTPEN